MEFRIATAQDTPHVEKSMGRTALNLKEDPFFQ